MTTKNARRRLMGFIEASFEGIVLAMAGKSDGRFWFVKFDG